MSLRAISSGDIVLITTDPQFRIGNAHTIAKYHQESNTLEMVDGFAEHLPRALEALRKYKRERNIPAAPVQVLYW